MADSKKIKIVTLGCAKNEVDSEEIAGVLASSGHEITGDKYAEVTIINTCGFLEASKQESIEAIKKAVRTKGKGKVIVAGCLAQRLGQDLERLAPGADAYIGVGQMNRFDHLVKEVLIRREPLIEIEAPHHRWADVGTRARPGHPWSAYLKVSEGCDHRCTFCTIPSFRGKHQSKPLERVLAEANQLVKEGVFELNLIAQDVTQYGFDIYGKFMLPELLKQLNSVEGIGWIRLLYFYPNRLTDEVIEAMATLDHVVKYIDIPLQHVHPDVLRRMKRPWEGERYLKLFEKLRSAMPDCAIRTTFIVGFPGETDQEFSSLIDFIHEARLDRVGAFTFSREQGTPSAEMPGQISHRVKRQRFDELMKRQQKISLEMNQAWVGKEIQVLVEEHREGWSVGRSFRDAPEIDGVVFIEGERPQGSVQTVVVSQATEYDLYAQSGQARQLTRLRMAAPHQPQ